MPAHLVHILTVLTFMASLAGCGASDAPGTGGGNGNGDGSGDGDGGSDGGGGGIDPPPTALFIATPQEQLTFTDQLRPAVAAMGPASVQSGILMDFSALPPAPGAMNYTGFMEIVVGATTAGANVAAPTSLTLSLSDLSITGSATGFMGITPDENLVQQVVNYAGTITISNGTVSSGTLGNAAVTLDIDGSLDSGLNVFGIDGTLVGSLYGTDGEGMRVRGTNTGLDGSMITTVDGAPGLVGVGTISALLDTNP